MEREDRRQRGTRKTIVSPYLPPGIPKEALVLIAKGIGCGEEWEEFALLAALNINLNHSYSNHKPGHKIKAQTAKKCLQPSVIIVLPTFCPYYVSTYFCFSFISD